MVRFLHAMVRAVEIALLLLLFGGVYAGRLLLLVVRRADRGQRRVLLGQTLLLLFGILGATFVKIAQYLSTRPDILPAELTEVLGRLQDRVSPFPYTLVWRTLSEELITPPEEIFAELDPYPIASASIAQVHRGRLLDGRAIAVKVLRPGIEEQVRLDLQLMRFFSYILGLLPFLRALSPAAVVEQFAEAMHKQLDLRLEAENNQRFARNFQDDEIISVPWLVPELCTRRVMCMEFVDGRKLTEAAVAPQDGELLARAGFRLLMRMIVVHGFVHADLHPGNLLVSGRRLVMLDMGLVAEIEPRRRLQLMALFAAWAGGGSDRVVEALLNLLDRGEGQGPIRDPIRFKAEVERLMTRYQRFELGEHRIGEAMLDMLRLLRRQRIAIQPQLTMVLLSIGIVEGVGRTLAPGLDLVQESLACLRSAGLAPAP